MPGRRWLKNLIKRIDDSVERIDGSSDFLRKFLEFSSKLLNSRNGILESIRSAERTFQNFGWKDAILRILDVRKTMVEEFHQADR